MACYIRHIWSSGNTVTEQSISMHRQNYESSLSHKIIYTHDPSFQNPYNFEAYRLNFLQKRAFIIFAYQTVCKTIGQTVPIPSKSFNNIKIFCS